MTTIICLLWAILIVLTGLAFYRGKIFLAADADVARDSGLPIPVTPIAPSMFISGTPDSDSGYDEKTGRPLSQDTYGMRDQEKQRALDEYHRRQTQYDVERPAPSHSRI